MDKAARRRSHVKNSRKSLDNAMGKKGRRTGWTAPSVDRDDEGEFLLN
jgi:hypothetical protein